MEQLGNRWRRFGRRCGEHPHWIACALLGLFAVLAALGAIHDSVTVDEFMIVPSGYAKLVRFGRANSLNAFNPPLVQMILASPLTLLDCTLPPGYASEEEPEFRWHFGRLFMESNRSRYVEAFLLARLACIVMALALAALVYRWSRALFGAWGGLASLALFCTCPNSITHGHLATVDMGFSTLLFASSFYLWKWRSATGQRPLRPAVMYSLFFVAALLAKFTALLLLPVHALLALIPLRRSDGEHSGVPSRSAKVLLAAVLFVASVVSINACYDWDGTGRSLGSFELRSGALRVLSSGWLSKLPSPLPEWYLKGIDLESLRIEEGRNAFFFMGHVSTVKTPAYFVAALLMKTPISTILIVVATLVYAVRKRKADYLHLLLPAACILALFSLVIGANLGLRYVLPVFPYLYTLAGIIAVPGNMPKLQRTAVAALLACSLLSALLAAPRFLSYFNLLAGGPQNGRRYLSDSNVDWGQDLNDLKSAMARLGIDRVYLSYFGLVDPALYGVPYVPLAEKHEPGVVAISVHHLNGIAPFSPLPEELVERLRHRQPLARAGDSILLFED